MESIIIKVPKKTDLSLLLNISKRMGFVAETLEQRLNKFIKTAPKNINLSDSEILNEITQSRKNAKRKY